MTSEERVLLSMAATFVQNEEGGWGLVEDLASRIKQLLAQQEAQEREKAELIKAIDPRGALKDVKGIVALAQAHRSDSETMDTEEAENDDFFGALRRRVIEADAACDKAEARLAVLEGERQWQPIATAPMDGTQSLFLCCGEVRMGFYDGYRYVTVPGRYTLPNPPTHWMPLPPSPSGGRPPQD